MNTEEAMDLSGPRKAATAIAVSTLLWWGMAIFVTEGMHVSAISSEQLPDHFAAGIAAAVMLGSLGVALFFRRRALQAAERANSAEAATGQSDVSTRTAMMERKKVKSSLSVAWQVLVLPAIFCAFFLSLWERGW